VEIIPGSSRTRFRDRPKTVRLHRGIGVHLHPGTLFGFIAESVFTFIPERCSGSSRNAVRNHPGIAFRLDRNPQPSRTFYEIRFFPLLVLAIPIQVAALCLFVIPKPGGGERPLGIPTIRDRVVQTAAKLLLEPIFEADFDPNAYGYRILWRARSPLNILSTGTLLS